MKLILEQWRHFINENYKAAHTHEEIVSAVDRALQILELSNNKNLRIFMIEIAVTESGFNSKGLSSSYDSHVENPFQLMGPAINSTQTTWKLKTLRRRVEKNAKMTNPWSSQTVQEIRSNAVMGAIAATMYIIHRSQPRASVSEGETTDLNVPDTISGRAKLWDDYYNTRTDEAGTVQTYITKNTV